MAAIDLIPGRYQELKITRNKLMSEVMARVETQVNEVRTRFEDLVWEAYDKDGNSISAIARAMGGSRTSVYDIIKKREEYNATHNTSSEYVEVTPDGFRDGNDKMPQFRVNAVGVRVDDRTVDVEFTTWWTGNGFFVSKNYVHRGEHKDTGAVLYEGSKVYEALLKAGRERNAGVE